MCVYVYVYIYIYICINIYIYIYIYIYILPGASPPSARARALSTRCPRVVDLYKRFFYCGALVHEPIIHSLPPPTCIDHTIAILLHPREVDLYKRFFYFGTLVHESIIHSLPPRPPALTTRLQYYCTHIAQSTILPPDLVLYAIYRTILVMAISCKGQSRVESQNDHRRE